MLKYLFFCLGLIGCLGMQNAAFSAPLGGTAPSSVKASHSVKHVDDYHHHRHHRRYHHHHDHF